MIARAADTLALQEAPARAYFREAGSGPGVVCLHANASSSSQWRGLMDRLSPKFKVLAADSYGHGKSQAWLSDRKLALRDEVALLEPVFDRAGETFTLIGHSFGASVALIAATLMPKRVRALALYEPTLFSLLDAEKPPPNDANGIRATVAGSVALLSADGPAAAAERFIDYWSGIGAWAAMPDARRAPIEAAIVNITGWAHALLKEPTPLAALAALEIPVLLMVGGKSPPSSRGVARLLTGALSRVTRVDLPELGHMGPITHPQIVNEVIADFLQRAESPSNAH